MFATAKSFPSAERLAPDLLYLGAGELKHDNAAYFDDVQDAEVTESKLLFLGFQTPDAIPKSVGEIWTNGLL